MRRPGVVRVECDSHGWMRAWIVVSNARGAVSGVDGVFVSNARGAVSGVDGVFVLEDVPAGDHELTIWRERLGAAPRTVDRPRRRDHRGRDCPRTDAPEDYSKGRLAQWVVGFPAGFAPRWPLRRPDGRGCIFAGGVALGRCGPVSGRAPRVGGTFPAGSDLPSPRRGHASSGIPLGSRRRLRRDGRVRVRGLALGSGGSVGGRAPRVLETVRGGPNSPSRRERTSLIRATDRL